VFAVRESVLRPGRQLAASADDRGYAGPIREIDAKALAGEDRDAGISVRPDKGSQASAEAA
jgi:hypothetical protein